MSVETVKEYLQAFGLESRVRELPESSATVELAAHALGTQPARIAKTLSFLVGEEPILLVAAGDVKIDNAKDKARFHQKAKMLTPEDVYKRQLPEAAHGIRPSQNIPGMFIPPEMAERRSSFSWAAARRASFTAAVTKSPNISASSGSITSG